MLEKNLKPVFFLFKKLSTVLLCIFFWQYFYSCSFAQLYNFRHYNPENGFPQANADAIVQDTNGYLWFATQVGAVRFDGKNYFIFDENKGVANNLVVRLFIDYNNRLWLGTRNGLSLITKDSIFSFFEKDGLPANAIQYIWQRFDSTIFVSTSKEIVFLKNNRFAVYPSAPADVRVRDAIILKDKIYLATNKGIYEQNNHEIKKIVLDTIINLAIEAIEWDKQNTIWLASTTGGLFEYDISSKRLKKINIFEKKILEKITCLYFDSRNLLWIGTEGYGAICYDGKNFKIFGEKQGMQNTSILTIIEDKERNMWFGGRSGVTFFNPYNPFMHYPEANNYSKMSVFGMMEDDNGNIWFTTYGNGLTVLKNGQFHYFNEKNGLPDNRLFSIIHAKNGYIWFSTAGKGIVQYDGKKFSVFDKNNGFMDIRVFKVFEDSKGNIWCCTQNNGVAKYDGSKFTIFTVKDGLSGNTIMSAVEDNAGNIWFGSFGDGITKYENGKFINYSKKYKIKQQNIRSITCDKKGHVWFGSSNRGIFRIDTIINDSAICFFIDKSKGLQSNNVYFVFCDSRNWLWIGTEKGIAKIILDSNSNYKKMINYGKSEGFIGGETSINGVMEDKNGRMWFGNVLGATVYDYKIEKENQVLPKILISSIKLFFQEQNWHTKKIETDNNGLPKKLVLPHNQNHLSFEFIGISLTNPEKVKYKYYLEGLDNSWSPETEKNEAVYSHIPPGNYTFKVIACNNDGYWNLQPATFSFTIKPPFWQTTWFIFLAIFFVVGIAYLIIHFRLHTLKQTKRILEITVKERTAQLELNQKEIQDKNFELHAINNELNAQKAEIEAQRDMVIQQKEHIEKIHNQLTESIFYAKRIQSGLLPAEDVLNTYFKNAFIFYEPLQIVSGDFYWATKIKNKIYFAVADCTGHGVPGAMMSMLGIAFLNDIVNKAEFKPHEILFQLRQYLIQALYQSTGNAEGYRDGMDIALCCYDLQINLLEYAGANCPIYLITNNFNAEKITAKDNVYTHFEINNTKFIEIKTPKIPLAIYENADNFFNTIIKISPGDVIYLFTDGFADQFGEANNMKYSYPKFRHLLFESYSKPFSEQKNNIWKTFMNWRGDKEQIDDVLVMGIGF